MIMREILHLNVFCCFDLEADFGIMYNEVGNAHKNPVIYICLSV